MDGADVESQTGHGDAKMDACDKVRCIIAYTLGPAIIACFVFLFIYYSPDEHYYVAIDSASALDNKTGLSFNLTLRVDSRSHGAKACIEPGMYVEVLYHGFQVAAWAAAADETSPACARPRNSAELPVVARAAMLPVGDLLDSLAAEMAKGAAVFDLRLLVPHYGKSGWRWLIYNCKGTRAGQTAVPCDMSK